MMKHILITIVGWVVTSIILSIMTYDTGMEILYVRSYGVWAVLSLYFFSIICTAGVGLIIWIFVWYGVGHIAIYGVSYTVVWIIYILALIIEPFTVGSLQRLDPQKGKLLLLTDRLNQELQSGFSLNKEQLALLNYIKKARTKGLNDVQITQNLTTNGWPTDSITAAFQMARNGV